jgi:drug/metabolite transporter (DMT)-like permease
MVLNRDRAAFFAVFSMMIFGTAFWAIVLALRDIPPVTLGFLRAAIAAVFMAGLYLFMGHVLGRRNWLRKELWLFARLGKRRYLFIVAGTAFFGTALPNILQNIGMLMMDPSSKSSLASLIQGVGPVFTIFLAWLFLKERLGGWKVAGLLVSIPCTVVLTTFSESGLKIGSGEATGGLLNLATAFSYSISGILLKMALNRKADPVALLGMNAFLGAVFTFPVMILFWMIGFEDPIGTFSISLAGFLALIYISICVYAVAAVIWYRVLSTGDLSRLTFYVFLLPVFSVLLGYLLLGERLDAVQLIAGLGLLLGVGIAQRSKKDIGPQLIRPPKP